MVTVTVVGEGVPASAMAARGIAPKARAVNNPAATISDARMWFAPWLAARRRHALLGY
jgi:hypothetical protein